MTSLRRVRRVSLRAPNEALVRRGALLLEDALRTAAWSLDAPGSLVVVRRLDVGAIDPHESPVALSARIEERLRSLATQVVPATAPSAEHAAAVRFRDPIEPAILLAEHVARSAAPAPWFLARAVRAYRPEAGPRHALRAALAAARDASASGPIALVEALLARGAAEPLFAALSERDGPVLLAGLGIPWPIGMPRTARLDAGATSIGPAARPDGPAPSTTPDRTDSAAPPVDASVPARVERPPSSAEGSAPAGAATAPPVPPTPPAGPDPITPVFHDTLAARVPEWGAGDPRSIWLAAAALLARAPALRHDPRLAARAQALAATFAAPRSSRPSAPRPRAHIPAPDPAHVSTGAGAEWSAWGGLLFLVPLLERLGMTAFLSEHPALAEAGFPLHVLRDVARRLGVSPDDPILPALGEPPSPLPDVPFTPPAAFARIAGPPPTSLQGTRGSPGRSPVADALTAFRVALRRTTRRVIRIGLRSLVARPARVAFTATHIDLGLDLRRVHLGIRRAGADIDPGYVPWLGRVIHFHYRHGEEPRA